MRSVSSTATRDRRPAASEGCSLGLRLVVHVLRQGKARHQEENDTVRPHESTAWKHMDPTHAQAPCYAVRSTWGTQEPSTAQADVRRRS